LLTLRNIKFIYLYRDGSNYKKWGEVVFESEGSDSIADLKQRIESRLESGQFFIASQVRLPDLFLWSGSSIDADDHCFHEFADLELTECAPNDPYGRTVEQLIAEITTASENGWRCFDPSDSLAF
jgi:hypothetical protein